MKKVVGYFLPIGLSVSLWGIFLVEFPGCQSVIPAYKNQNLPVGQRVEDLLRRMTLKEKIAMLSGAGFRTNETKATRDSVFACLKLPMALSEKNTKQSASETSQR